jgi:geranylgeranyl diphosphate synthase type II
MENDRRSHYLLDGQILMPASHVEVFPPEVQQARELIDQHLDRYSQFDSECPDRLRAAIRYSLLAPGKRLRPLLALTAAKMCGGQIDTALPGACAVEMIHTYSLIHDDLPAMDDDDMRRGQATCHVQFDEATAILAGDALIPRAFEILTQEISDPSVAARSCGVLASAAGASKLVGGQVDDLAHQFAESDIELLQRIHNRKTGALLIASLQLGAISAKASPEQLASLEKYGKHLGLAFQIVDDLLDLKGDQAKMGKRTQKDSELGKLTYPAVLGVAESESRAQQMADVAIESLRLFGDAAEPLIFLAKYVVERSQ